MRIRVSRKDEGTTTVVLIPGRTYRAAPVTVLVPEGEDMKARVRKAVEDIQEEGTQLELGLPF